MITYYYGDSYLNNLYSIHLDLSKDFSELIIGAWSVIYTELSIMDGKNEASFFASFAQWVIFAKKWTINLREPIWFRAYVYLVNCSCLLSRILGSLYIKIVGRAICYCFCDGALLLRGMPRTWDFSKILS